MSSFFFISIIFLLIQKANADHKSAAEIVPVRLIDHEVHSIPSENSQTAMPSMVVSPLQVPSVQPRPASALGLMFSNERIMSFNQLSAEDILFGRTCEIPEGMNTFTDFEQFFGHCLPEPSTESNIDFSRDLSICHCLAGDKTSAQGLAYAEEVSSDRRSNENNQLQESLNKNIRRLNSVLAAEQNAMRIQASTLPASDRGGELLAAAFTNRFEFNIQHRLSSISTDVAKTYSTISDTKAQGSLPMESVTVPNPDPRLLAMDQPAPPRCIPVRAYMTARQMPTDPLFFEDLASLPARYEQNNWDYTQLKIQFISLSQNVTTLEEALENPAAKKIYLRLQFLERNPLYKNLFSSTHPEVGNKKQELLDKIRAAYGPQVPGAERLAKFEELRRQTGAFFTNPAELMNDIVQSGAGNNMQTLMGEIPRRVESIIETYDPAEFWYTAAVQTSPQPGAESTNGRDDVRIYAKYCPQLMFASRQNQYAVLNELEQEFANAYDPDHDPEYELLNRFCGDFRRSRNGRDTSTYLEFEERICRQTPADCTPEKKPALITRFLEEFPVNPNAEEGDHPMMAALKPFFEGQSSVPRISEAGAVRAGREGANRNFFNDNSIQQEFREMNGQFSAPSGTRNTLASNSFQRTSSPSATASVNSSSMNSSMAPGAIGPVDVTTQGATSGPQETRAERVRTQLAQSDSNVQSIRDEISSLTRDIRAESAKDESDRNDQLIRDLNSRLDQMNNRLSEALTTNGQLRDQLAGLSRPSEPTQEVRRSVRNSASRSGGIASVAGQAVPSSSVAPSVANSVPVTQGAALAPSASSASRRSGSSINSALLSRSSANSGSQGAITVATAPSAAEYQNLRDQSVNSSISESVPLNLFQQFSQNNQSALDRYIDQVRAMPGDVVRLAITAEGTGQELELFFVKNGNQISLVPAGQAPGTPAPRAPASVPDRTNRLEDLNRELGTR